MCVSFSTTQLLVLDLLADNRITDERPKETRYREASASNVLIDKDYRLLYHQA